MGRYERDYEKDFLLKVMKCMKGFATPVEIKEEYDALSEISDNPSAELVANIKEWLLTSFLRTDPEMIIWERMNKEGLL